jgi:hypothetical protein
MPEASPYLPTVRSRQSVLLGRVSLGSPARLGAGGAPPIPTVASRASTPLRAPARLASATARRESSAAARSHCTATDAGTFTDCIPNGGGDAHSAIPAGQPRTAAHRAAPSPETAAAGWSKGRPDSTAVQPLRTTVRAVHSPRLLDHDPSRSTASASWFTQFGFAERLRSGSESKFLRFSVSINTCHVGRAACHVGLVVLRQVGLVALRQVGRRAAALVVAGGAAVRPGAGHEGRGALRGLWTTSDGDQRRDDEGREKGER